MTETVATTRLADVRRPPIWELGVACLACTVISTIWLASYIPNTPNTIPSYVLLAIGTLCVVGQLVLVGGLGNFSRASFHEVSGWALAAYVVIGGMIEYVFLRNHVRGEELGLLTWGLALFVVDVPLILGFSVARYQPPE